MTSNFQLKSETETRNTTQSTALNFFLSNVASQGTNTLFYMGIKDWNALPDHIKEIRNEIQFKEKLKQHIIDEAIKEEMSPFTK